MAERDASLRLRRAVQENNLFLVKRLIKRTDMRNPDPNAKRYTSLAWAATQGHEETFQYLLSEGHDDDELSKDSENNTILIVLADGKPPAATSPFRSAPVDHYSTDAALRMAKLYYDRYPHIRDWANLQGKTALHAAAMRGNEELVRMLLDLDADFDLTDNQGNTPLHYASAWGHVPIVQLLIERGCQYSARNNEGFTASDYAFSNATRDTLQDTARAQFENNKRIRRHVFAQVATHGNDWPADKQETVPSPVSLRQRRRGGSDSFRMRSGSGGSRTTDSDFDSPVLISGQLSYSPVSSPPHPPSQLPPGSRTPQRYDSASAGTTSTFSVPSPSIHSATTNPSSALSPIATRMLERDADAMQKYKSRTRSGSAGTASTDVVSQNGSSAGLSVDGEEIPPLNSFMNGSVAPRRLLRPSASAAQLRSNPPTPVNPPLQDMLRTRSGTTPVLRSAEVNGSFSATQNGASSRPTVIHEGTLSESDDDYSGPSAKYARFPSPMPSPLPPPEKLLERKGSSGTTTPTSNRRLPFNLLSKPLPPIDPQIHRRGASTTS